MARTTGAIVGVVAAPHARYRVYLQRRNDHDSGLEFNKQVNASIVDPGFIARVRKKLALDQRQAAIFGGGPNAFSRYENGKTKPPLALVKLLMVLDRHPHLLNEVRAGQ
jgi:putative zinc finger/helix-turn-helix YgiT family protein